MTQPQLLVKQTCFPNFVACAACSRLSDSGEDPECLRFLNSADPVISEPGTFYSSCEKQHKRNLKNCLANTEFSKTTIATRFNLLQGLSIRLLFCIFTLFFIPSLRVASSYVMVHSVRWRLPPFEF